MYDRQEILKDYLQYTDCWGLIQPGPIQANGKVGTSQNGLLYSAQYAWVLWENKIDSDTKRLLAVYASCEQQKGLYIRDPKGEHTSIDDGMGLALVSKLFNPRIAQDILSFGVTSNYFYGIGLKYWWGRFPQLIGALRIAAGLRPTLFQRIYTLICFLVAGTEQDAWTLSWIMGQIYINQSWYLDWAIKRRGRALKKAKIGGIGQNLGEYFNNMAHPSARYLWGEF